jgi:hypothetical protein
VSVGLAVVLSAVCRVWPPPPDRLGETAWLATVMVGAIAGYVACHAALRADEVRLAWSVLARRWPKGSLHGRERR